MISALCNVLVAILSIDIVITKIRIKMKDQEEFYRRILFFIFVKLVDVLMFVFDLE